MAVLTTCGNWFWCDDDDCSSDVTCYTSVTVGGPVVYYVITEWMCRRWRAERYGNATRPIFGLLWEVE